MTSRKENDIEESLPPHLICQMSISSDLVHADIRAHVLDRVINDNKLKLWPAKARQEIVDTLTRAAGGMFRWTECQLDCLGKCLKLDSLRKTLHALPKTLEDTYDRILCNIDEEYQEDALKVLQWLCFSARPMNLHEMVEVLAIDLDDGPSFKPEQGLPDPRSVLTICSTLVTVTTEKLESDLLQHGEFGERVYEVERISLAHYSVKNYLTSTRARPTPLDRFRISPDASHTSIAMGCLTYLLCFQYSLDGFHNVFDEYPLAKYAADRWAYHYKKVDSNDDQDRLTPLALCLFTSNYHLTNWQLLYDRYNDKCLAELSPNDTTPLRLGSLFGLKKVVQKLLDLGADVNNKFDTRLTALHVTSSRNSTEMVQLLLSNGANIDALDDDSCTPLMRLCLAGGVLGPIESTARLLLEGGAYCNAQDYKGQTALHIAVRYGSFTLYLCF